MNNNRLVFFIGCALIVLSGMLLSTGSIVDVRPYMIVGAALVLGGMVNEALGGD